MSMLINIGYFEHHSVFNGLRVPYPTLWEVNAKGEEDKWSFERMIHLPQKVASILSDTWALGHGDQLMIFLPPAPETCWSFLDCVQLGKTRERDPWVRGACRIPVSIIHKMER